MDGWMDGWVDGWMGYVSVCEHHLENQLFVLVHLLLVLLFFAPHPPLVRDKPGVGVGSRPI